MIEYDVMLKVKVDDEKIMENILITLEPVNLNVNKNCAIEFVNINISEAKSIKYNHNEYNSVKQFELDSWLSPITINSERFD